VQPALRHVLLQFDPRLSRTTGAKERSDLSVAVAIGETLWVASDETVCLTRLSRQGEDAYGSHTVFDVSDFLALPGGKKAEADIEGLDYADGCLWITGSHSLKRGKPEAGKGRKQNLKSLAQVTMDSNRFLLGCIPVAEADGGYCLVRTADEKKNRRTAALLRGDMAGNDLTRALADDEHLGWSIRVPSKDNGLDIEGLAALGERVLLGLRGPVLRGFAVVLEIAPKRTKRGELRLKRIGPGGRRYCKHFLDLRGLGIREMCADGDDLLLLAGPTMDLDGPTAVYRWRGGASPLGGKDSVVLADRLEKALDVPYGTGEDHAEGITFRTFSDGEQRKRRSLLVVYDSPSPARKQGENGVLADTFDLGDR
jgi:hypothetical protein